VGVVTTATMTAGQAAFWRAWQKHDPDAPARFTPGRYVCPVGHPGGKRTLKVHYEGSRVSGHCFEAGCGWQQVIDRLGVRRQDLDDDGPARGGKLVGVYPYPDESGAEVLRVHRYERPASTRYQVWTGGEWRWDNRAGARTHLLYRLPHVLDAVQAGERVYLVDSEASADALFKAGVVATTIAGKPGAHLRTSHIEWLRDGYVTIVARRDPAGRDHARLSRAALAEVVADVEVVEPNINRPHATAADHLAAGLGLDDFAALGIVEGSLTATGIVEGSSTAGPAPTVTREQGAGILARVAATYRRFVRYPSKYEAVAVALWTAHTWAVQASYTTPYLFFSSAEPESGKTRNLEVAECLVARPWRIVEATEAVLFRKIERDSPTVLYDEVDALWRDGKSNDGREGLRAVLNEGYRRGAKVPRCVGDGHELVDFSVFGAKAFAGLGKLPRTIATRSITIRMQKRTKDEPVQPFSIEQTPPALAALRARLDAWVAVVGDELRDARPDMPASLSDRQADIWRPLLALADAAGGGWPELARDAAIALHGHDPAADPSVGVLLLRHVREVFDATASPALHTAALLRSLVDRDDGPWAEWWGADVAAGHTKGPGNRLASILKPYEVAPDQVWAHGSNGRGYRREWFEDAWKRHLPNVRDKAGHPNVREDVRTLEPRSEAISGDAPIEPASAETGPDQQPNVLTFQTTLGTDPNVSQAVAVRCPACGLAAEYDPGSEYGRRALAAGHCGQPWETGRVYPDTAAWAAAGRPGLVRG
jgi:hypothetical protein